MSTSTKTPVVKTYTYATFWQRFWAGIIDGIVIYLPFIFLGLDEKMLNGIVLIFGTVYFVWMNGKFGYTIGKKVMKCQIIKENGDKIDFSDAFVRELASYISVIVLFIGYLVMISDPRKQTWHDRIANTVVVKM